MINSGLITSKDGGVSYDLTNLGDYFTMIKEFKSGDYASDIHMPEDFEVINENVLAASHRTSIANGSAPVTGDSNIGGIIFYDVRDKTKPVVLDTWKDTNMVGAMQMRMKGDYLYVISLRNPRLFVLDVSNPRSVTKLGEVQLEPSPTADTSAYKVDISEDGNYAVTCWRQTSTPTSKICSVDISNPAAPTVVSTVSHVGSHWLYYLWTRRDKVFVTHYGGGTAPGTMSVYDIDNSTGVLSFNRTISQPHFNGIQHITALGKDLLIDWQGNISVFDIDPYTGDIVYSNVITTTVSNSTRVSMLSKNDTQLFAIADYYNERVELLILNNDMDTVIGSGEILNAIDFDTVQTVMFMDNYLFIGNRMNSSAMYIYMFDFNAFAGERKGQYDV